MLVSLLASFIRNPSQWSSSDSSEPGSRISMSNCANRLRYLSITLNTMLKLSVQRKVYSCLIWKWLLDTRRIFILMIWCISSTHYLTINRCCRYELALDLSLTWLRVQFVITPASQPTLHSCKSQLGVKQKMNENNIFKQKKKKKPCWFKWEACSSHILFLSQLKGTEVG